MLVLRHRFAIHMIRDVELPLPQHGRIHSENDVGYDRLG